MTTTHDDYDLPAAAGPAPPRYLSRRKASIGLAATGCVTALALARLVSGQANNSPATPLASPGASPMASPGATPTSGAHVSIQSFSFVPASLEVPVGTTVMWTNNDDIPHTVTSDDHKAFASGALDTGEMFAHRFSTPGTYPYFCSFHPFMTAKVIVK